MKLDQLVTPAEAARLKDMSLNGFLYYYKRNRTPPVTLVGPFKHPFFDLLEIQAWQPEKLKSGRKKV